MTDLYDQCLDYFKGVRNRDYVVSEYLPVPYFGDKEAYEKSPLKVLTLGINPAGPLKGSTGETSNNKSAYRFDVEKGLSSGSALKSELSGYFSNNPSIWFKNYNRVLMAMGTTYGGEMKPSDIDGTDSTALHFDLCSPVATDPKWSGLTTHQKATLTSEGRAIAEETIRYLKPSIIVASVGWPRLKAWREDFRKDAGWTELVRYPTKKDGQLMAKPISLQAKEVLIAGRKILLTNATASQTPYGSFTTERRQESGAKILAHWRSLSTT